VIPSISDINEKILTEMRIPVFTVSDEDFLIEVVNLTKKFDGVIAVDELSFCIRQGEFFGFLGPNGAGKTTTINILTGLARPDSGSIRISDRDCTNNPKAAQHLIGVVPDDSNLYPELSGYDNLCFCASLYGMRKIQRQNRSKELLATFGLDEAANRKFGGYSKGMKRKLTIAAGIIHNPRILFMDEPTTGLDVGSARQIRLLISRLHHSGTTIFLTTHYIEEAERLCQRIAFIVKGKIVKIDSVSNLLQPVLGKKAMLITFCNPIMNLYEKFERTFPNLKCESLSDEQVKVESMEPICVGPLVRFFEDNGSEVMEARRITPSLEDVFVITTGIEVDTMRKEREKPHPNP
jgi:ABC-2 type transport system ATP-binding protein